MALEKKTIDIPLFGGVNDELARFLTPPGKLRKMENCYQTKIGLIARRPAQTAVSLTGIFSSPRGLSTRDGSLVCRSPSSIAKFSAARDAWYLVAQSAGDYEMERGPTVGGRVALLGSLAADPLVTDCAIVGDYACFIYTSDVGKITNYSLVDLTSKTVLSSGQVDTGAFHCKVVALSDRFVFVYRSAAGTDINGKLLTNITSGAPTLGSETLIVAGTDAGSIIDARESDGLTTDSFAVAYTDTGGTVVWINYRDNTMASIGASSTGAAAVTAVSLTEDNGTYMGVIYSQSTIALKLVLFTSVPAVHTSFPVVVETAGGTTMRADQVASYWSGSILHIYYTKDASGFDGSSHIQHNTVTTGASVGSDSPIAFNASVAGDIALTAVSEPLLPIKLYNGDDDGGVGSFTPGLCTYGLVSVAASVDLIRARWFVGEGLSTRNISTRIPSVSTDKFLFFFPRVVGRTTKTQFDVELASVTIDVTPPDIRTTSTFEHSNCLYHAHTAGLTMFDGESYTELGFHTRPPVTDQVTPTGSGGNLSAGDYFWAAMYSWVDAQGNLHRGQPSIFPESTVVGSDELPLVDIVTNLRLTGKNLNAKAGFFTEFYRTAADGAVLNYEESIENDPDVHYISGVVLESSDSSIAANKFLYTTGGILSAVTPPAAHHVSSDGDMVALVPADSRKRIWFSKPLTPGVAPEFNPQLAIQIPQGDDIEAVEFLDQRTIVFMQDQVRWQVGRPDSRGVGLQTATNLVTATYGCNNWRSIVQIPDLTDKPGGILFRSQKGWCFLDRGLGVRYVGGSIRDSDNLTIVRSFQIPDRDEIRIVHTNATVLVYNYRYDEWATWDYSSGSGVYDATIHDGDVVILNGNEAILRDNYAFDDGITATVRTPWVRTGAIGSVQRVYRATLHGVQQAASSDAVTVKIYIDNDETTAAATVVDAVSTGSTEGPLAIRFHIPRDYQKCQSMMFEISWVDEAALLLKGAAWSMLTLEVGVKRGMRRGPGAAIFSG